MRAQRHKNVRTRSPPAKMRDHRSEWRRNPCPPHLRDTNDRRSRLSPLEVERSRRIQCDRRSPSVERREYNRQLDGGKDRRVVRSRSPLYGQARNISQFDVDSPSDCFHRKYLFPDHVYSNADTKPSLKYVSDSCGPSSSGIGKQKDFLSNGSSALEENGMLVPKSLYMDGGYRSFFTLPPDVAAVINSGKVGDIGYRKDEDLRYSDHPHPEKIASRESYKEKPAFYVRDAPYATMPSPHSKAFGSTSSGPSKDDFLGFYGSGLGGRPSSSDGFPRTGGKITDSFNHDDYGQAPPFGSVKHTELRQALPFGSGKHTELRQKNLASYQPGLHSPSRLEASEYHYPELGRRERIDPEYLSANLYRKLHANDRMDYDHSNSLKPSLMDPVVDRAEAAVGSHRTLTESVLWDQNTLQGVPASTYNTSLQGEPASSYNTSLQGEPASNYYDVNRTSWAAKQDGELLGSRSSRLEFRPIMSRDHDTDMSESGIDYGYGRDAGPLFYRERLQSSTMSECDPDIYGLDVSPERRLKAESQFYDPSVRVTDRNNTIDEEMNRHNHRYMSSSNDNAISQIPESIDSDEQWTGEHSTSLLWSKRLCSRHPQHGKKSGRVFDRMSCHKVSAPDDWMSSEDLSLNVRVSPMDPHIAGSGKVSVKKRLRLGPKNFHSSYPLDRKHSAYRPHKFRNRNQDDFLGDVNEQKAGPSKDQGSPEKPEPPEGSEKFNQKAYEAFLRFCKQLNENPAQQRRYKEQGNAGSLLCIVCGSQSKEFGDTRSLATHAAMLQKQSRADHRGLHKAICVLMGWKPLNSSVPRDGSLWVPAELPESEALALKEDLILWPPLVIIHNSSIANKDPDRRKVITIENMEAILKEMGFGVGKAKVCHGRPANQSVMVVKFGPTFSGLQDAERLHKYYSENKRGRVEFQQINANSGGVQGDEVERVLYGYLGIVEDLYKLDFGTKGRALVKSKKDIQAIADAPLKTK